MKILIADDDPAIRKIIRLYFEKEQFQVTEAADGESALTLLFDRLFDLAILDWMMPKINGLQICREIHQQTLPVKTILLTAKSTVADELKGLTSGADDYLRKPFDPSILILRAKKLLKIQDLLIHQDISLNPLTKVVMKKGQELQLSKIEFELLWFLLKNKGMILSRDQLLLGVWGYDYEGDPRTVDTHINRLRAKIGEQLIFTHRGVGYCMEVQ